ncbi:g1962 [Coccomyxa elongata]
MTSTQALGCACSCLTNGRAPAAFASLALTGSKVTEEGIRASVRSAWAGLGAGFLHTLSGPDHLAALTPLTIGRSSFRATLLGALWGFGHSIGQLILGLLMVVLKDRFTSLVPALSKYGSVTVGLTLLVIGVGGLYETWTESSQLADETQPALAGAGGPVIESQAGQSISSSSSGVPADVNNVRTLFTGIVFGLQPDALFVIVPALALPTKLAAMAYIFMFVFGTVAAMGSYTAFIGATSNAMQKNYSGLCTKLSSIASVVAIGIGSAVLAAGFGVRLPFV